MKQSNSFAFVDREIIDGSIGGCDFGPKLWCIGRSPRSLMVWIFGHSWSNNGFRHYAEPHLTMIPRDRQSHHYTSFKEFGRLTEDRFREACSQHRDFSKFFPERIALANMQRAVGEKKTMIIEGGGSTLMPARSLGWKAARDWKLQHRGANV